MILELKIKNYLSFKDEVTYSFEATSDTCMENTHVVKVAKNVRILKLGIVYGANASGKSNLINAFEFLGNFWSNNRENKNERIGLVPFMFDEKTKHEPSEFKLVFYINRQKYLYSLSLTDSSVISEKLIYYPGVQPAEIFSRKLHDNISLIKFGPKVSMTKSAHDEISVKCLPNMSLFAAYNRVNLNIPEIESVIKWIENNYLPSVKPRSILTEYVEKKLIKNKSYKEYVLNFLAKADFNIKNIKTEIKKEKVPEKFIELFNSAMDISNDVKEKMNDEKFIEITNSKFVHEIFDNKGKRMLYELDRSLQSQGTIRTLGISGVINTAILQKAFLAIDEIEASLHPKLVEFIIETFLKQSKESQLLVTTHYDGLLEQDDMIRNDNIWFTNKMKNGSTELYSLANFNGVNRISSLQKAYKFGKFGAIPNI